jgi:hypothetical protein
MSLLNDASLLITPNAYKQGKLYSVIPSNGNGDFSVTRATTATRTNASGLIESTPINEPRLDYSLGSCPNILLEPQRTNLALRSEEFSTAAWIKSRLVITANSLTSPSGVINASTITETTFTNNFSGLEQSIIVVSGTTYTQSIFVKKGNIDYFGLIYFIVGGANGRVIYDLNTKLTTNTSNIVSSSITDFLNGWLRITMTYTANASAVNFVGFFHTKNSTSLNYNGNATGFTYAWGAQLEAGAYATSYIPTTSASVTRNADVISRGNIFTNGLITASGGTWFVELRNNIPLTRDAFTSGLYLSDTGLLNMFMFRNDGQINSRVKLYKRVVGSETQLYTTLTDNVKAAFKWNGTTADIFINGVKVVSETAFTATALEFLNGSAQDVPKYINSMALLPTPLTDTQCIALTT